MKLHGEGVGGTEIAERLGLDGPASIASLRTQRQNQRANLRSRVENGRLSMTPE